MNRGVPSLSLIVVPHFSTSDLIGITGSLQNIIENKQHSYIFDFSLDARPERVGNDLRISNSLHRSAPWMRTHSISRFESFSSTSA